MARSRVIPHDRMGRNWSRCTTERGVRWAMQAGGRKYYVMVAYEMLADPYGRKLVADWIRQTRAVLRDMVARHGV